MTWKYIDPNDKKGFIPEGTGQVLSFKSWEEFMASNASCNEVVVQLAQEAGFIPPSVPGPGRDFTCYLCYGVFTKSRTEEEGLAEMKQYFGDVPEEDRRIVCDACWNKIHPQRN